MKNIKTVIFDMDGVIINSIPFHYKSLKALFKEYEIDYTFSEYLKHDITAGAMNVIPRVFKSRGRTMEKGNILQALDKKNSMASKAKIPLFPGVRNLIKDLHKRGYRLAVASGGTRFFVTRILKKHGIRKYFSVVVTGDDNVRKKPFPDIYIKAAKKLRVSPKECVVIEDSHDGVTAAKRAGMYVIGHKVKIEKQDLQKADKIIKSMRLITKKFSLLDFLSHSSY